MRAHQKPATDAPASSGLDHPRFHIVSLLGTGGMGAVYKAFDRTLETHVALKTLLRVDPSEIVRFKAEFRALADLRHPSWVRFGELFEADGRWFFTMDLVEGTDFLSHVRGRKVAASDEATVLAPSSDVAATEPAFVSGVRVAPAHLAERAPLDGSPPSFDEARLRRTLVELSRALNALHAIGKVHRDVKPTNLLVTPTESVVLLDFGLVADARSVRRSGSHEDYFAGTVAYMAPEQASPSPVGPEADWYAVGAMLYEALMGDVPIVGSAPEVIVRKQVEAPAPPSARGVVVPPDLEALCMDLLRIDPAARPRGEEILERLAARDGTRSVVSSPRPARSLRQAFVGRERELMSLGDAFAVTRGGGSAAVLVVGESGGGKSALVKRFTEQILEGDAAAVAFAGRCYENEWVPFKAFDGVIDALSAHLAAMPRDQVRALLPEKAGSLAQTFVVLQRVEAIASSPAVDREILDPREQRARVFAALRELLGKLAASRPIVVAIDDLQWADADSLALLREVLREPDAPPLLLLATMRTRSDKGAPDPAAILGLPKEAGGDVRVLRLEPLTSEQTRELAVQMLGPTADAGETAAAHALAKESGGHPLFLQELMLHRGARDGSLTSFRLDDALWERAERLDAPELGLLSSVVLAGRLTQETAARASGLSPADYARHAAALRSASLVRTGGRRGSDEIEPYHDRVREAVVARLSPDARRAWHERIATAVEALAPDDHEALAAHWRGAGDRRRAKDHALHAARRADAALAFDRAAELFALAIELGLADDQEASSLNERRGDALVNAGRGADAARAYLAAAAAAAGGRALDLRRRGADQLLRSGHIDESLAVFRGVLAAVGMDMPATPKRALAALLVRRAQIRLRGLGYRATDEATIAPATLTRIDACWSAAAGLGLVDTMLGQYFQARGLLFALEAGEPRRVQRALAMEAAYSAADGGKAARRTASVVAQARELAAVTKDPYGMAFAIMSDGCAAMLTGEWKRANLACDRAERAFIEDCKGATWEIGTVRWFSRWALGYRGSLAELARRVPVGLREAEARGDLYNAIGHSTGMAGLVWLAADDPDGARARSREALARWSQRTFHVEHWWATFGECHIDLYSGDAKAARDRLASCWRALDASLLLMVQLTRIEALHVRAQAALGVARAAPSTPSMRRELCVEVLRDAATISKERMGWSNPIAALLRAAVAALRDDVGSAARQLEMAAVELERRNMDLHAAAARWQWGRIVAGDAGRDAVASSEAWMRGEGIVSPARMARLIVPGFSDP